ncbi:hypothetical protein MED297_00200 [Reinekea sp. MED297]|uniref:Uncharacterized protein n=1 Tax=Reinekea blandensis MED297 TaxID=314283 RepID=A4BKV8_9GAMM|nr:hypothetical protein MED297_00200 [Reinekea sp. MED297] [Reinekea blandensis MED297]
MLKLEEDLAMIKQGGKTLDLLTKYSYLCPQNVVIITTWYTK